MKRVEQSIEEYLQGWTTPRGDAKVFTHMTEILYGMWERTDTDLDFVEWWDKLWHDAFPERSYNYYDKRFE